MSDEKFSHNITGKDLAKSRPLNQNLALNLNQDSGRHNHHGNLMDDN